MSDDNVKNGEIVLAAYHQPQGHAHPDDRVKLLDARHPSDVTEEFLDDGPHIDPERADDPSIERAHDSSVGEIVGVVATIIKSFIGSGVLFLPKAFHNGGWLFSSLFMLAIAFLTQVTILRLIECRSKVVGSYAFVGYKAYGRFAKMGVDIALVLSQAGFGCVYVIFIARNVLQLLNVKSCWISGGYLWVLVLLELPLLAPMTWIRKLKLFAGTNVVANAFIVLGLLGILIYCGAEWDGRGVSPLPLFNTQQFPLFLGTAVYAFEGIGMVVPIYDSLSTVGQRRFPLTLSATLFGVAAVYIIIGLVPYLFFEGVEGVLVQDAVTLSLPREWWAFLLVAAYCLAILFSYPFMMFPAIRIIERGCAGFFYRVGDGDLWKSNIFRTVIVAVTLAISYTGSSQLDNLVSLVGCFACTPLAFIFPAMFHYKLVGGTAFTRYSNLAIAAFGVAVFVFSTYQAIATWSITSVDACAITAPT